MKIEVLFLQLLASFSFFATSCFAECVWGGVDASRLFEDGAPYVLEDGELLTTFRSLLVQAGVTIANMTGTLTENYLDGIDVFFTSHLGTPGLSSDEQSAVDAFARQGKTLIAADYLISGITPFVAAVGITNWRGTTAAVTSSSSGSAQPTNHHHPITHGVENYGVYHNSKVFDMPAAGGLLLGEDGAGGDFMAVFEQTTCIDYPGRVFVMGDYFHFRDNNIGDYDNQVLLTNLIDWACDPPLSLYDAVAALDVKLDEVEGNLKNETAAISTALSGIEGQLDQIKDEVTAPVISCSNISAAIAEQTSQAEAEFAEVESQILEQTSDIEAYIDSKFANQTADLEAYVDGKFAAQTSYVDSKLLGLEAAILEQLESLNSATSCSDVNATVVAAKITEDVQSKLDNLEASIAADVEEVKSGMEDLKSDMDSLKTGVDNLKTSVAALAISLSEIGATLDTIKNQGTDDDNEGFLCRNFNIRCS
jgi:predicted  nucleic acid-binding Zn-ribbon protein